MLVERARWSIVLMVFLVLAVVVSLPPDRAVAAACGREPGDALAAADVVAAARAACPCASFSSRDAFRACVRDVIDGAIGSSSLPKRCRSEVMRYARTATCGARSGKVACCKGDAGACSLAASEDRCRASRGGTGIPGTTESCYDACVEPPAPTPGAPTPTPGPSPSGPCCGCGCAPPYYYDCPGSSHQCSMPAPGATTNDDCDALDVPGRLDCEFLVACDSTSGGIPFPLCQ